MKQWDVHYSPTFFINEKKYCVWYLAEQCQARNYADFVKYICNIYKGSAKPAACNSKLATSIDFGATKPVCYV